MNNTTLNQSQSHQQSTMQFIKPNATVKVKANLKQSLRDMHTTRHDNSKGFKFMDPLDNIVKGKKRRGNHLYQSYHVPSSQLTDTDI
jgi:hypothetical protein